MECGLWNALDSALIGNGCIDRPDGLGGRPLRRACRLKGAFSSDKLRAKRVKTSFCFEFCPRYGVNGYSYEASF
jgi:hypothetical protein